MSHPLGGFEGSVAEVAANAEKALAPWKKVSLEWRGERGSFIALPAQTWADLVDRVLAADAAAHKKPE